MYTMNSAAIREALALPLALADIMKGEASVLLLHAVLFGGFCSSVGPTGALTVTSVF